MNEIINQNALLSHIHADQLIKALDPKSESFTEINQALTNAQPILIACSGGADSVLLLCWLYRIYHQQANQLHVAHFNHGIREDAQADEIWVTQLCRELNLSIHTGKPDRPLSKNASEAELRAHRHGFFQKTMKKLGAHLLITGHHLDDAIETIILRLGRGSGIEGLSAPREVQHMGNIIKHVRPLMRARKSMITQALREMNISWREDSTNQSNNYTRNAIRNELLPLWESINPQELATNIGNSHALLQEANQALQDYTDIELREHPLQANLALNKHLSSPDAILRRIIHNWASSLNIEISDAITSSIIRFFRAQEEWTQQISTDQEIILNKTGLLKIVQLVREEPRKCYQYRLWEGAPVFLPDGHSLNARFVQSDEKLIKKVISGEFSHVKSVYLDIGKHVRPGLLVRNWQAGDSYQPLGMLGSKKLQDCFTDQKIPANKRRQLPVILNREGQILWIPGLLPNERHKVTTASNWLLQLTYLPFSHSLNR